MATSALIGLMFLAIAGILCAIALRDFMHGDRPVAQRVVDIGLQVVCRPFGH